MTDLLSRLFVKNYRNASDARVRLAYGTMVSITCIIINFLLSGFKFLFGFLLGSIALMADAINNLSDAGSSLITLISFRIAAKPADRDHPFGHARMELVASMIVAFLILLVAVELGKSSIEKIVSPQIPDVNYALPSLIVLGVSILVKLWMGVFNRKIGNRIDSSVMRATAADSLMDCLSTFAVFVSTLLFYLFGWNLDAYLGVCVSVLICIAGLKILNETKNSILGEGPVEELVDAIKKTVSQFPEVLGIHDLIVHNYGPGHIIASLHAEVDGGKDFFETHDVIDNIERQLFEDVGVEATIHADPIVVGDPEVDRLRGEVTGIAKSLHEGMCIHDFRFVRGQSHSNLIFDVAVPFECPLSPDEVKAQIDGAVRRLDAHYRTVITVDRI